MTARFIVLEGGDGAGKSTLARNLATALQTEGRTVVHTREPGGSPKAEEIRSLILNRKPEENFHPDTQLLLHYAARLQHLSETVVPALRDGAIVICDRFEISSFAYQVHGHRGSLDLFLKCHAAVVEVLEPLRVPCVYVHCVVDPAIAMERIRASRGGQLDVHDTLPLDFKERVAHGTAAAKAYIHPIFAHVDIDAGATLEAMVAEARLKLGL